MRNRTWLAALALTGCALLGAGCRGEDAASRSGGPAAATAATAASSATGELLAAAEALRGTSYKFSATTAGIIVAGAADPVAGTATMDVAAAVKIIVAGGRYYVKLPEAMPGLDTLGVSSDTWLRVDIAKVPVGRLGVPNLADPAGGYHYLKTATSVQKIGDRRYKGTMDLTKLPSSAADPKVPASFADSARAVPFEVTLDDKGRLSTMDSTLRINGTDVATRTMFSDYGTKVTVTEPAASEVAEAPQNLYGMLGT